MNLRSKPRPARTNLKFWFRTTVPLGTAPRIKVCVRAKLSTDVRSWIVAALHLRAILKAYLGDKTSQFRGNDTEDHGRWIICIVLRDSSFIIDDYNGRCTCSYDHDPGTKHRNSVCVGNFIACLSASMRVRVREKSPTIQQSDRRTIPKEQRPLLSFLIRSAGSREMVTINKIDVPIMGALILLLSFKSSRSMQFYVRRFQ